MTLDARVHRAAIVCGVLTTLTLAGCGGNGSGSSNGPSHPKTISPGFAALSGAEIISAGITAMKQVGSVRLRGNMVVDGSRLDIDALRDEDGLCAGSMSQGGGTARFIATPKGDYLKANEKFWRENGGSGADQVMRMLGDKWAKLPDSDEFEGMCDIPKLLSKADGDLDGFTVGTVTTFGGMDVVPLSTQDGRESYRVLIGVDAPHYLVRFVSDTKGDKGDLVFSQFEKVKPIDVPGSGEYVDIG